MLLLTSASRAGASSSRPNWRQGGMKPRRAIVKADHLVRGGMAKYHKQKISSYACWRPRARHEAAASSRNRGGNPAALSAPAAITEEMGTAAPACAPNGASCCNGGVKRRPRPPCDEIETRKQAAYTRGSNKRARVLRGHEAAAVAMARRRRRARARPRKCRLTSDALRDTA